MNIEYLHASKYGNGATVAKAFQGHAEPFGITVDVHHIRDVDPAKLPPADVYVFSSPGRFGKPIRSMRRFLGRLCLPTGTHYAILTTELRPASDETIRNQLPEVESDTRQRIRPIMEELLEPAGLVKVADTSVGVTTTKGPLEDDWQTKVEQFVEDVLTHAPGSRMPDEADG